MKRGLLETPKLDTAPSPAGVPRGRAAATFAARLTFDAVERRYGERMALAGFSLDVAPGEVVCLLGPSGCGKTTLLRVAAGIEKPSGRRILIDDYVKLHAQWVADWDKIYGYRQ